MALHLPIPAFFFFFFFFFFLKFRPKDHPQNLIRLDQVSQVAQFDLLGQLHKQVLPAMHLYDMKCPCLLAIVITHNFVRIGLP